MLRQLADRRGVDREVLAFSDHNSSKRDIVVKAVTDTLLARSTANSGHQGLRDGIISEVWTSEREGEKTV